MSPPREGNVNSVSLFVFFLLKKKKRKKQACPNLTFYPGTIKTKKKEKKVR